MARYFFNLHECGKSTLDDDGINCSDVADVRVKALQAARELMCAELAEGRLCLSCHIEVKDERGDTALLLPFKDAVNVTGI